MRLAVLLVASLGAIWTLPAGADHEEDEVVVEDADEGHHHRPRRHHHGHTRIWVGVGTGLLVGSVDEPCPPGEHDCSENGLVQTYSGNFTVAGAAAFRFRGIRAADEESNGRTPYETAALVGLPFGYSSWYGLIGGGRIHHADDGFQGEAEGLAWELLYAPPTHGGLGLEISFQGNTGRDVDFVAFNIGARFGALW